MCDTLANLNYRISVIIPAFNAERTLDECLKSVINASPSEKEIILVDDASTDRTREIASTYPIRLLCQNKNMGQATAKNRGLSQVSSEIIAFIDSDCIINSDYFLRLLSSLDPAKNDLGGVGGILYPVDKNLVSESFNIRFFGCSPLAEAENREIESISGAASMYPKKVLTTVGGFDESLGGGEDLDLNIRIRKNGYKLFLVPSAKACHMHPAKLTPLIKKWFNYGQLLVYVSMKNGSKNDVLFSLGWLGACFFLLLATILTPNMLFAGFFVLTFWAPWALFYGKETVGYWRRNPKIKYILFPFIHQAVIIARSFGVINAIFLYAKGQRRL
jgi:O-antigen biosynthesis protein